MTRHILANYVGQGAAALLALVFIPVYVRALGAEGYGLIGLYSALYAVLGIVDSSVQALIARAAAYQHSVGSTPQFADRLRTFELTLALVGLLIIGLLAVGGWFGADALDAHALDRNDIAFSLSAIGIVLALRLYEGLYRACLIGLEQQVLFNAIHVFNQTVRWGGAALIVTWVSPNVQAFFLWQVFAAAVSVGLLAFACYSRLGWLNGARVDWTSLWSERRFLSGMLVISGAALLLTQTDKLLLVKLLPLAEYGNYALAATAAGALMLAVTPIADTYYPRLVRSRAQADNQAFAQVFHQGARWVTATVGPMALVGVVFADTILAVWTRDAMLAKRVAPLFQVLLIGNLLNAFMWMPYRAQLAAGWTGLAARINVIALSILVPLILVFVPLYGAAAAAWIWVALNGGYIVFGINFMFRKLLTDERKSWYLRDLLTPLVSSLFWIFLIDAVGSFFKDGLSQLVCVFMAAALGITSSLWVAHRLGQRERGKLWGTNI